jgi:hypothetical protein
MVGGLILDIVALGIVAFVGWTAINSGVLDQLLKGLQPGQLQLPGAQVGGGVAGGGAATGTCTGGPYKSTGKTASTKTRGPTERHYASGKPDTTTIEKNAKGFDFQNYQFVNYVTLKKIDEDDNVSLKVGGRHMSGGWWDHGVSFKEGETCLGSEKKHPSTNACVVKGAKIGSIVGKKVGVAATVFRDSGKTEIWTDTGGGWKKGAEGENVDGFKPLSGDHEAQLRIDAAPGVEIHCSVVQEIAGGATAAGKAAYVLSSAAAYKSYIEFESSKQRYRMLRDRYVPPPRRKYMYMYYRGYPVYNAFPAISNEKVPDDCGDIW